MKISNNPKKTTLVLKICIISLKTVCYQLFVQVMFFYIVFHIIYFIIHMHFFFFRMYTHIVKKLLVPNGYQNRRGS